MSKLDKDEVLAKFTEAYKAEHGKEPQIEAKSGWYSVDGGKNIRLAQLVEMTEALSSADAASDSDVVAKSATPAKETKKPAASQAKSIAKPTPSGFSVKAYWSEQISQNPGSTLPR